MLKGTVVEMARSESSVQGLLKETGSQEFVVVVNNNAVLVTTSYGKPRYNQWAPSFRAKVEKALANATSSNLLLGSTKDGRKALVLRM